MARKGKLLAALDAHKGRDHEKERQKKMMKQSEKLKRKSRLHADNEDDDGRATSTANGINLDAVLAPAKDDSDDAAGVSLPLSGEDSDESEEDEAGEQLQREEQEAADAADAAAEWEEAAAAAEAAAEWEDDDGDDDDDDEEEDDEDIPMSDIESLASEDREDILPHQRLTINNTAALLKAHKAISLSSSLPFSASAVVLSPEQIEIPDVNDDLSRELAFYKQCLDAAVEGRSRLRKEGVPFSRPNDFFAEMVKTDEHMGKVKAKMIEAAASKKASAEARKQRDLKKFGKQVQIAKQQERDRQKRETLDRINVLKRKRKDMGDAGGAKEEDMFDVALDNETKDAGGAFGGRDKDRGSKRVKKDAKFGFGGKKRFAKSNDAMSSGDMRGYSAKGMKAGAKKFGKAARPGKSKRAQRG